jgi:hypothetical protein
VVRTVVVVVLRTIRAMLRRTWRSIAWSVVVVMVVVVVV